METALASFGLVFLAELGDKSMLVGIALAARYRPWPVLAGIAIAAFSMLGLATVVGSLLGSALPTEVLSIGGGLLFIGFGLWTLRDDDDDEDGAAEVRSRSVVFGVTLAFLVAEFGDKTMLAAAAIASTRALFPTWIGASLGMIIASGLAILVAHALGSRLPERAVRLAAAGGFLVFGALMLLEGIRG
jgi:Ca2+/H+ antiporter, TMEM165/GDT1 family